MSGARDSRPEACSVTVAPVTTLSGPVEPSAVRFDAASGTAVADTPIPSVAGWPEVSGGIVAVGRFVGSLEGEEVPVGSVAGAGETVGATDAGWSGVGDGPSTAGVAASRAQEAWTAPGPSDKNPITTIARSQPRPWWRIAAQASCIGHRLVSRWKPHASASGLIGSRFGFSFSDESKVHLITQRAIRIPPNVSIWHRK
jgi:hypothetical protein